MKVEVTKSHREECVKALHENILKGLEVVGIKVTGYAHMLSPVDTGRLKNSITWVTQANEGQPHSYKDDHGNEFHETLPSGISEATVVFGTNVEYAA